MTTETTCQRSSCNRPADGWFICATCAEEFVNVLADMAWMLDQLDTVITQQTRYSTQRTTKGATTPLVFNVRASDTKARLVVELNTAASLIATANRWTLPTPQARSEDGLLTGETCAAWLERSISAVRLHPHGAEIVDSITSWHTASVWVIDRPAQRQYLGDCTKTPDLGPGSAPCPGRIYGQAGKPEARCDTCGATYPADEMRNVLLKQLDDRYCTAAEIAKLSTYLGLPLGREQVRKRINQWHRRGLIEARNSREVGESKAARARGEDVPAIDPTFRFHDALTLLHRHESGAAA